MAESQRRWIDAPFSVVVGPYHVLQREGPPSLYDNYARNAALVDVVGVESDGDVVAFVAAALGGGWPSPWWSSATGRPEARVDAGWLSFPRRTGWFVGAGEGLLCYALDSDRPRRLWEDAADMGFAGCRRPMPLLERGYCPMNNPFSAV